MCLGSSHCVSVGYISNFSSSGHCKGEGSIPGPAQWVKGASVAAAVAQPQFLARELPYDVDAAIKLQKKKKGVIRHILPNFFPIMKEQLVSH